MSKRTGCMLLLGGILLAFILSLRPWETPPEGVVQDILQGLRTGRPCGALTIAIDHSRIECFQPRSWMACIRSRRSDLWIMPREIQGANTLFGIPFEVLRKDGEKYWVYQPKLDITFAVDGHLLVDFAKGKITSDTLFRPVPAGTQSTALTRSPEPDNFGPPPSPRQTSTPTANPR